MSNAMDILNSLVENTSRYEFTERWKAIARDCRQPNWDSYKAHPVTDEALRTASFMDVVPSVTGGINLEIHAGGMDVEISIDSDGLITEVVTHRHRGDIS